MITVSIGDTVRVKDDYDAVKALQTGHGEWNEEMKKVGSHASGETCTWT